MKGKLAALAAILALGGAPLLVQPAAAQPERGLTLSRDERNALTALQVAASGVDRTAQDAALVAARAAVRGADGRYALAHYQFEIGRARGDAAMQSQAVDMMVESGLAQPGELPALLANQAERAYSAGDHNRADRLLARAVEIQPNNAALLSDAGQMRARMGSAFMAARRTAEAQTAYAAAVGLLQRAIEVRQATGLAAPESWHQRALDLAFDNRMAPQAAAIGRGLVAAFPSPMNWRDALLAYKTLAPADPTLDLDVRRLMRASQGLGGERDYLEFATALRTASLYGEAKSVLDEGISREMLQAAKPIVAQELTRINRGLVADRRGLPRLRTQAEAAATGGPARSAGDAFYGYGQYAEAAALYRIALLKGGEDPNLVNTRLGAALAMAGQRADAEIALRAVTGPRADLAGFWLAWLARRAG